MNATHLIACTGLLTDLPVFVAQDFGYFTEESIQVSLSLEMGWASIEGKLTRGHLAAAVVPPSFPLLLSMRHGTAHQPMRALASTACGGQAITLHAALAASLKSAKPGPLPTLRLGYDAPNTLSHAFLKSWLKTLPRDRTPAVQIVPIALSQILDLFHEGYLQGFCCAEPLGQITVESGTGITIARFRDQHHPTVNAVLGATEAFCCENPRTSHGIATAVVRARHFCADPQNETAVLDCYDRHTRDRLPWMSQHFTPAHGLAPLVTFEPTQGAPTTSPHDPMRHLTDSVATLPGLPVPDQTVRDAVRSVFSSMM